MLGSAGWIPIALIPATLMAVLAHGSAMALTQAATYEGAVVSIGHGAAHTIVRTDVNGKLAAIGVEFAPAILESLPQAMAGAPPDVPFFLPMPTRGPRTIVDHVVIDWEPAGHPPPHVYDVPHFDFHFYLVSKADQEKVSFKSEQESGDPAQQPPLDLLPAGYVVPPGTAMSRMGVHAIDSSAAELHGQPFTASFIYGYYDRQQTFLEVMASVMFLESKPSFSAPVKRPRSYTRPGAYPSAYSVRYDASRDVYDVMLTGLE
jgi:hypothetical protein